MPGMHSGLNLGNPVLVAAFRSALLHQGLIALLVFGMLVFGMLVFGMLVFGMLVFGMLVFGMLALAWVSVREWRVGEASRAASGSILTGWRLTTRSATHTAIWARTQTMKVSVPYGSSG